jgi:hypothetical protein
MKLKASSLNLMNLSRRSRAQRLYCPKDTVWESANCEESKCCKSVSAAESDILRLL